MSIKNIPRHIMRVTWSEANSIQSIYVINILQKWAKGRVEILLLYYSINFIPILSSKKRSIIFFYIFIPRLLKYTYFSLKKLHVFVDMMRSIINNEIKIKSICGSIFMIFSGFFNQNDLAEEVSSKIFFKQLMGKYLTLERSWSNSVYIVPLWFPFF